jgi:spore maturation protein CgeB
MTQLSVAVVGLSLSSSWGNGHATTYRSLLSGLRHLGHRVLFLEREQPWYLENRDLVDPSYCDLRFYRDVDDLGTWREVLTGVDAVIVGSYVPDGIDVIDRIAGFGPRLLCFYDIDTPVTLASLARGEETYVARRQLPDFDLYLSFSGGTALDRLRREFGVRRAEPLHCAVDPHAYAPTGEQKCWDLGYLGTYSEDRQPAVDELLIRTARLLPRYRFAVAGPQYPPSIRWPDNVERIEHLAPVLHRTFYSRQRYTLNVTRADMIATGWSPSVRLFEAAATATPVISDRWEGLSDFFPEPEAMSTAATAEEVAAILERDPAAASGQGEAARRIVLSRHTGLIRAGELADMIRMASRPAQLHLTSKSMEGRHAAR